MAGDGADNIGKQSGGWTLSWQGTGNSNSDFPGGTSFYDGVSRHVKAAGGSVELSEDGSYKTKPDVAMVVFGEEPYAEFKGDIDNLSYNPGDDSDLNLLKKYQAEGIPVVAKGALPYSWPRTAVQTKLNVGDEDYDPLFAYGYGLSYAKPQEVDALPEEAGISLAVKNDSDYFRVGKAVFPWSMYANDSAGKTAVATTRGRSPQGIIEVNSADDGAQENIRLVEWDGRGEARFEIGGNAIDLSRQTTGDMAVYFRVRRDSDMTGTNLDLGLLCGKNCAVDTLPLAETLAEAPLGEWQEYQVKLSCFAEGSALGGVTAPFTLTSDDALQIALSDVRLVANEGAAGCLK